MASGDPVIVEVAVPADTVPAALTNTGDVLDEAEVGLLSERLNVQTTSKTLTIRPVKN